MKIDPLLQPFLRHVSLNQLTTECQKFFDKLTRVISKNLRENREDHEERSAQTNKGIQEMRQTDKLFANNLECANVYFLFLSRVASRWSA